MKLLSYTTINVKVVNYFGNILNVPTAYNYMSTDYDGAVWVFYNKPELQDSGDWHSPGGADYIAQVKFEGDEHHSDSCVEI